MTSRRALLALLGLLSAVPLAFFVACGIYFLPELDRLLGPLTPEASEYFTLFDKVYYGGLAVVVLNLCLGIAFLLYAAKSRTVPDNRRAIWIALFFVASVVAMPLFWYHYMWKQTPRDTSTSLSASGTT